jgi:hypothetical protein
VFQKGFQMIFCNSGPIAAACYLGKDVVQNTLDAFIQGVTDLIVLSKNIKLLSFRIQTNNKNPFNK